MNASELETTFVGKIVTDQPSVARVFEQYQIDYCCRGKTTLADACDQKDIAVADIVGEIERLQTDEGDNDGEPNWNEAPLSELANNIVETHHRFLVAELPRISEIVAKVNRAHGEKRPELANVASVFAEMREELETHMFKEERILFPAICALEAAGAQQFPFGSIGNPIGMMEHEHDSAGEALRKLRELTDNFTPPPNACPTYCVMMESLENLEQDLHIHIHKENNILFPRAQELER